MRISRLRIRTLMIVIAVSGPVLAFGLASPDYSNDLPFLLAYPFLVPTAVLLLLLLRSGQSPTWIDPVVSGALDGEASSRPSSFRWPRALVVAALVIVVLSLLDRSMILRGLAEFHRRREPPDNLGMVGYYSSSGEQHGRLKRLYVFADAHPGLIAVPREVEYGDVIGPSMLVSLAVHLVGAAAAAVAWIGCWFGSRRVSAVLIPAAAVLLAAQHLALVSEGIWQPVFFGMTPPGALVVELASAALVLIAAIVLRDSWTRGPSRRTDQAFRLRSPTRRTIGIAAAIVCLTGANLLGRAAFCEFMASCHSQCALEWREMVRRSLDTDTHVPVASESQVDAALQEDNEFTSEVRRHRELREEYLRIKLRPWVPFPSFPFPDENE